MTPRVPFVLVPFLFCLLLASVVSASTTTIVETISPTTVTASASASASSDPSYTSDSSFKNATLEMHNYYRAQYNASDLSWNSSLADYAANYSEGCRWAHSGGPNGENLAYGYLSASTAITAWANESHSYSFSHPGFSESTGHFTQLVWKATTSLGCGRYDCNGAGGIDGWYVVCEYWPAGNVVGEFGTEVQKPISNGGGGSSDSGSSSSSSSSSGAERRVAVGLGLAELLVGLALGAWAWGC